MSLLLGVDRLTDVLDEECDEESWDSDDQYRYVVSIITEIKALLQQSGCNIKKIIDDESEEELTKLMLRFFLPGIISLISTLSYCKIERGGLLHFLLVGSGDELRAFCTDILLIEEEEVPMLKEAMEKTWAALPDQPTILDSLYSRLFDEGLDKKEDDDQ